MIQAKSYKLAKLYGRKIICSEGFKIQGEYIKDVYFFSTFIHYK